MEIPHASHTTVITVTKQVMLYFTALLFFQLGIPFLGCSIA
jgi:hypothetical protein